MTKKLVANLYNPHEQTKEELIKSFVVRHKIFRKLFRAIKRADMLYPEQHFLIEGQRGMGKTTLLLRLSYEIENDSDLNTWLVPVVLKEEAHYGITRLFKLWETVAQMLADRDTAFAGLFAQMENAYAENSDYERICFGLLTNALEKTGKKIILFIDNVGEMFKNFDDMESHRLREILMTCAQLRIVGATAVTLEASFRYDHAFYEFFKKESLARLDKVETHNLLLQLAEVNQTENAIQNIIAKQPGRVESLRILTGGVIRTVVILFDIFVDNQNGNAISDLDGVLDRVTPLYKHRMDDIAPLQRDVVHTIALNWDAISPDDIARKARLKKEEVFARLGELEKVFIVQRAATDTQTHLYYLNERFFNIWYLMRLAPKGSQAKVIWLVRFLESWYDEDELIQRAKRQIEVLSKGDYYPKGAFIFTEALVGTEKLDEDTKHELISATKKFLEKKDNSLSKEFSRLEVRLQQLRKQQLNDMESLYVFFLQEALNLRYELHDSIYELHDSIVDYAHYSFVNQVIVNDAIFNNNKKKIYELPEPIMDYAHDFFVNQVIFNNNKKFIGNIINNNSNSIIKFFHRQFKSLVHKQKLEYEKFYSIDEFLEIEEYIERQDEEVEANMVDTVGSSLAWLYFEPKISKEKALKYATQVAKKENTLELAHTLACIYLWNNKFKQAIQVAGEFMYSAEFYKEDEDTINIYLMLLIAKQQYQHTTTYFEAPDLNLKNRFKPLYYALLYFTGDKNYAKRPPELTEPVNDIIAKIKQMAVDYA
jgi:nucleoside-triphosphatase THEP1